MGCPKLNYFDILKCASLKAPRGQRQHTSKNKKHICLSAKKKLPLSVLPSIFMHKVLLIPGKLGITAKVIY